VKSLFQRRKVEAELEDEIRFHMEQEIQAGMTPDEILGNAAGWTSCGL
jgi:hypothetical protein